MVIRAHKKHFYNFLENLAHKRCFFYDKQRSVEWIHSQKVVHENFFWFLPSPFTMITCFLCQCFSTSIFFRKKNHHQNAHLFLKLFSNKGFTKKDKKKRFVYEKQTPRENYRDSFWNLKLLPLKASKILQSTKMNTKGYLVQSEKNQEQKIFIVNMSFTNVFFLTSTTTWKFNSSPPSF